MTTLPINYCYGLSVLHYHWSIGGSVVVTDCSMIDGNYWRMLKKFKVTSLQLVPYNFELLYRMESELARLNFRTVFFAGTKMNLENRRNAFSLFHKYGIDYCIQYGQTETVSAFCGLKNEEILQKKNSIGKIYVDMQKKIDSENEQLIISGESICMGYAYNRDELKLGNINQGIINTGDCAWFDSDGYIYLTGRISRFIKILGIRYSLDEMEELLQKEFSVQDIVCVGSDDNLKIFVVGNLNEEKVQNFCWTEFKIPKQLMEIVYIDKIPINESGKILYGSIHK